LCGNSSRNRVDEMSSLLPRNDALNVLTSMSNSKPPALSRRTSLELDD